MRKLLIVVGPSAEESLLAVQGSADGTAPAREAAVVRMESPRAEGARVQPTYNRLHGRGERYR